MIEPDATHQTMLELVAEARLCCEAIVLGSDSLLIRCVMPADEAAELTALKRMAQRCSESMDALFDAMVINGTGIASDSLRTMVEALAFYAKGENHAPGNADSPVMHDQGRKAREALSEVATPLEENE